MNDDIDGDKAMENFENLLGKLVRKKDDKREIIEDECDADSGEPSEDA